MLDNIPSASPTTAYPASRWTSYRTPRYPSKWLPVDRQQNIDTEPDAIFADSPDPTYNTGYATSGRSSYQTPMHSANLSLAIEQQGDSDIEIGATSESFQGHWIAQITIRDTVSYFPPVLQSLPQLFKRTSLNNQSVLLVGLI